MVYTLPCPFSEGPNPAVLPGPADSDLASARLSPFQNPQTNEEGSDLRRHDQGNVDS